MRYTIKELLLGLTLLLSLSACNSGNDLPVSAASLRENLPRLEETGVLWNTDAYLTSVKINLLSGNPYSQEVSGAFQSPTENSESFLVRIEQDGSVTTKRIPHSDGVIHTEPIMTDDWSLDARDALEKGLTDEGRRFLEENTKSQCSFMYLERDLPESPERVVWRIELGGCLLDPPFQRIVIDANTGEIVRKRTY